KHSSARRRGRPGRSSHPGQRAATPSGQESPAYRTLPRPRPAPAGRNPPAGRRVRAKRASVPAQPAPVVPAAGRTDGGRSVLLVGVDMSALTAQNEWSVNPVGESGRWLGWVLPAGGSVV